MLPCNAVAKRQPGKKTVLEQIIQDIEGIVQYGDGGKMRPAEDVKADMVAQAAMQIPQHGNNRSKNSMYASGKGNCQSAVEDLKDARTGLFVSPARGKKLDEGFQHRASFAAPARDEKLDKGSVQRADVVTQAAMQIHRNGNRSRDFMHAPAEGNHERTTDHFKDARTGSFVANAHDDHVLHALSRTAAGQSADQRHTATVGDAHLPVEVDVKLRHHLASNLDVREERVANKCDYGNNISKRGKPDRFVPDEWRSSTGTSRKDGQTRRISKDWPPFLSEVDRLREPRAAQSKTVVSEKGNTVGSATRDGEKVVDSKAVVPLDFAEAQSTPGGGQGENRRELVAEAGVMNNGGGDGRQKPLCKSWCHDSLFSPGDAFWDEAVALADEAIAKREAGLRIEDRKGESSSTGGEASKSPHHIVLEKGGNNCSRDAKVNGRSGKTRGDGTQREIGTCEASVDPDAGSSGKQACSPLPIKKIDFAVADISKELELPETVCESGSLPVAMLVSPVHKHTVQAFSSELRVEQHSHRVLDDAQMLSGVTKDSVLEGSRGIQVMGSQAIVGALQLKQAPLTGKTSEEREAPGRVNGGGGGDLAAGEPLHVVSSHTGNMEPCMMKNLSTIALPLKGSLSYDSVVRLGSSTDGAEDVDVHPQVPSMEEPLGVGYGTQQSVCSNGPERPSLRSEINHPSVIVIDGAHAPTGGSRDVGNEDHQLEGLEPAGNPCVSLKEEPAASESCRSAASQGAAGITEAAPHNHASAPGNSIKEADSVGVRGDNPTLCNPSGGQPGDAVGNLSDRGTGEETLDRWLPSEVSAVYAKKGVKTMYPWQRECLMKEGVLRGRNLIYCASTSAGKSLVAEVIMIRRILSTGRRAMLVLPYVALCAEKAEHVEALLEPLGKRVRSFFGTFGGSTLPKDTDLAVCTIEKANALVNRLLEEGRLGEIAIVVVDELHMASILLPALSLFVTMLRPSPWFAYADHRALAADAAAFHPPLSAAAAALHPCAADAAAVHPALSAAAAPALHPCAAHAAAVHPVLSVAAAALQPCAAAVADVVHLLVAVAALVRRVVLVAAVAADHPVAAPAAAAVLPLAVVADHLAVAGPPLVFATAGLPLAAGAAERLPLVVPVACLLHAAAAEPRFVLAFASPN
ncbi:hypothetical protein CBR_g998 [Chara braunii]|uniref:Helicase ATP-binding domain-containing protein n=1 Tax=Chara braunii TaxID=69332 RepID=A0A388KCW2_CHABU|nr:hypothetical protein CBR_g998 [Chara braunii]|eukprot:GBG67879.1 hypothetical protein CBR_g998 [Chara braunii]